MCRNARKWPLSRVTAVYLLCSVLRFSRLLIDAVDSLSIPGSKATCIVTIDQDSRVCLLYKFTIMYLLYSDVF
jgi:hypothetical protein